MLQLFLLESLKGSRYSHVKNAVLFFIENITEVYSVVDLVRPRILIEKDQRKPDICASDVTKKFFIVMNIVLPNVKHHIR